MTLQFVIVHELVAEKIGFGIRKRDQTYYTSIDAKFNVDYEYIRKQAFTLLGERKIRF